MTLPMTIRQGILNLPGPTPESKAMAEQLLEKDRDQHHCFWGKLSFHNHLSHHILAAYDLGASAKQLQAIYNHEKNQLNGIDDRKSDAVKAHNVSITADNWTEFLGVEGYYPNYLSFFIKEVTKLGAGAALEQYVFAPKANDGGVHMLLRFISGAVHPIIQTGYAAEFGSDAMLAQALAQTSVHSPFIPDAFDLGPQPTPSPERSTASAENNTRRQPSRGRSLFSILREAYDVMRPAMPYNPNAGFVQSCVDAAKDGRAEEIKRLSALWYIDGSRGQAELDEKVEELLTFATLLLVSVGKPGRKPRLDFFTMHILNVSLFVPSLLRVIPSMESKVALLRTLLHTIFILSLSRGLPRINTELIMSYTAIPRPPTQALKGVPAPHSTAIGDTRDELSINPWPQIVASVIHAPDAHTVKAIRALYYSAQRYGTTPVGGLIGAFEKDGKETIEGIGKLDGTVFVRAAGVVMDTLGWVDFGQEAGDWDRSGLGWDEAWENEV